MTNIQIFKFKQGISNPLMWTEAHKFIQMTNIEIKLCGVMNGHHQWKTYRIKRLPECIGTYINYEMQMQLWTENAI